MIQATSTNQGDVDRPSPAKYRWKCPAAWIFLGIIVIQTAVNLYRARDERAALRSEVGKRIRLTRWDFFAAASDLAGQYTRERARTGSWPRPEEVRKELPLLESRRNERERCREDIYQASTSGVTIRFRLQDDGGLSILYESGED